MPPPTVGSWPEEQGEASSRQQDACAQAFVTAATRYTTSLPTPGSRGQSMHAPQRNSGSIPERITTGGLNHRELRRMAVIGKVAGAVAETTGKLSWGCHPVGEACDEGEDQTKLRSGGSLGTRKKKARRGGWNVAAITSESWTATVFGAERRGEGEVGIGRRKMR